MEKEKKTSNKQTNKQTRTLIPQHQTLIKSYYRGDFMFQKQYTGHNKCKRLFCLNVKSYETIIIQVHNLVS